MSQQNIDFGTFPDDPSADAIRTAFNKVQNNFDQLFGANANTTVTSINRTPGAGITVNYPTGNVVVSANLACLQVSTSSLKMGRGGNTGSNALITQSSQTLVIDIDPDQVYSNYFADVNNGLAIFNGNLSSNSNYQPNLTSFGNLTSLNVAGRANFTGSNTYISSVSNLHIPGGGAGYTIVTDGAGNLSWSAVTTGSGSPGGNAAEIQFQGSGGNLGLFEGNAGFTFNSANGLLQTPLLTVAGNTIAANFIGALANGNSNISISENANITLTANSNSTMLISDTGANITGTANISGNANVGNIGAEQGIFTTSANIPVIQNGNSNVTIGANTTVSIYVAGNTNAAISATTTGANILGIANVSSDIVAGGNISTTGNNGTVRANNITILGAATGNANISSVTGNFGLSALAATYTDNSAIASATIANSAIHKFAQPTLAAANTSVTFTNAATLYVANAPAAGSNATITNPYSLYIANGSTYFGGANNYIAGNLTVAGNTTYYNVDSFNVKDPIISLGGGVNGAPLTTNDGKDRGTALQYYTTTPVTAFMGWDNSNGEFSFGSNVSIASEVVTYNNLGNARGLTWLGNVDGAYANFTGNITTTGNANLGNSAVANYFIGRLHGAANSIANGTSNVNISTTNGNVTIGVAGNASIVTVTGTGVNVAGTLDNGTGNANLGNLGAAQVLASANVTSPQFISNIDTATGAPFSVQSTNRVANLNVSYANVSDYSVVTTQNTGTWNPVFVSASPNGNYALASNSLITANLANGTLIATTFVGNITGNIGGILANGNSNVSIPSSNGNVNLVAVGNTTLVVTGTGVNVAGTLNTSGNANVGNLSTATANITTINSGLMQNGNSNVSITANANVAISVAGANRLVVTSTGANITGTANVSGNANTGNLGTTTLVATTGNITTINSGLMQNGNSNITVTGNGNVSTFITGNATSQLTVTATGANIAGYANVVGNITAGNLTGANLVSASYLTGTLTTAAQPNITSVGTLSNLTVSNIAYINTSIGKVGIGTSTPSRKLSVFGDLSLGDDTQTTSLYTTSLYGFRIMTPDSNPNTTYESMRFTSSGYVGVGNVSPSDNLSVEGTFYASGNANVANVITARIFANTNITTKQFISNITTANGPPFSVQSVARVANLSVDYANVSDYIKVTNFPFGIFYPVVINGNTSGNYVAQTGGAGIYYNASNNSIVATTFVGSLSGPASQVAITAQTTGTYYPVVISGATTGNYAESVGPTGISFNLATNTVTATTFSGNVTASGTVQAANITATAYITRAVTTGISANGAGLFATQANATPLTTEINIVSTVNSGAGVRLPAAVAGTVVYITNNSANSLLVYPQTNGIINSQAANAAFTQGANATLQYMAPTTTQWYTIGATYA